MSANDIAAPHFGVRFVNQDGTLTREWIQWVLNPTFQNITLQGNTGIKAPNGTISALNLKATNPILPTSGGLGINNGTSGGIIGFTGATTIASSALLGQNQIVLGGGAGVTPSTPLGLGSAHTVLHGNAGGAPTWSAVDLTADVTGTLSLTSQVNGVLPLANGGTGDGTNFNWTGATKTLVVRNLSSDGTNNLASATPNGTGATNSGNLTGSTGTTVNGTSGGVVFSSGAVSGTGVSGQFNFQTGAVTSGNSGAFLAETGNATSGTVGLLTIQGGNATTGKPGDIAINGGASSGGPGGTTNIGNITLTVGFSGSQTGSVALRNSFLNPVLQVTDDGVNSVGELGVFGATPINRPTTAFAAAAFVQNAGNAVNDASTFDGYTIKQVVKALRSLGVLA